MRYRYHTGIRRHHHDLNGRVRKVLTIWSLQQPAWAAATTAAPVLTALAQVHRPQGDSQRCLIWVLTLGGRIETACLKKHQTAFEGLDISEATGTVGEACWNAVITDMIVPSICLFLLII